MSKGNPDRYRDSEVGAKNLHPTSKNKRVTHDRGGPIHKDGQGEVVGSASRDTLKASPYITRIWTRNGMASSATWYSAVTIPLFIEVSYGKVQETTR